MVSQLNIFVIYTSEDTTVMQSVLQRLNSFENETDVTIWHDVPILPEQPWMPKNESRLDNTDLFLLLVSDTFMHSQFIQQLEFKMVIDRYKEGKSTVIPVIIDKCPWDIDFRSDDYNFNLNELGVLPDQGKPIKEWDSTEEVYDTIAKNIKSVITSVSGNDAQEESEEEELEEVVVEEETIEEKTAIVESEEQMALSFDAEKEAEAEKRRKAESEAKRIAEEKRARENAEAKQRIEAEQRSKQEADARQKAEEQRKQEAAEAIKFEEQRRLKEEAERKRRKAEEVQRAKEESKQEFVAPPTKTNAEVSEENTSGGRKKVLVGVLIGLLTLLGIWIFTKDSNDKEIELPVNTKTVEVEDSISDEETEIDPLVEEELPVLAVGDNYEGGLIFALDADGNTGKIVHIDDAGPMPWLDAMIIHDKLGKGWRLPTLDELKVLYKTVGQGASNSAEFADKLYWSATPYDEHQARLLQFRTGNTSYHYNKQAEHRKFLVRAVRDFSR